METSVIGGSQIKVGRVDLGYGERRFCNPAAKILSLKARGVCFDGRRSLALRCRAAARLALNAVRAEALTSDKVLSKPSTSAAGSKPIDRVRLYVGLPLDAVSDCHAVNHARAIEAGLKALKLLGVDGVELPVWWGVAEKETMGKYEWSGYLALAEMVQKAGLKLHASLCFHASKEPRIPLPEWVSQIGEAEPSIFFKGRSGQHYKDCLSFAVDELPVLNGKTPVQVYQDFCENFKSTFSPFMESTITGISVGLGPDGDLRYPSCPQPAGRRIAGVGEFQCYDKNMLHLLKQHAEATGNPLWGLGGPHDAPSYNQLPNSNDFFKEHGGSWETPYGDFFLSWYSSELISHGNRVLSLASSAFNNSSMKISGKVPVVQSWYKTRAHPSELTAGFYNTIHRDGYEAVAEMFFKNSCKMILPGMDLSDAQQSHESRSSPELLLAQIKKACRKHGVEVSGQNSLISGVPGSFEQIKKNLSGEAEVVDLFTYQRMGASFFSPKHFPLFSAFVRSFKQPELFADDLPLEEEENTESLSLSPESGKSLRMQAA